MAAASKVRGTDERAALLAVAVILLLGGIAGIGTPDGPIVTKIGAAIAIGAGLVFLHMAAVGRGRQQS